MVRLNLMPWRERQRARVVRRFQWALVASLVLALIGLLSLDQLARARLARQVALTALHQGQLNALKGEQAVIEQLRREREEAMAQQAALVRLRAGQARLANLFEGLERAVPRGAQLTTLSVEQGRLRLTGVAASAVVVAQFMRDLERMAVVGGLELVYLRRHVQGDEFLLTGQLPADWS